MIGQLSIGRLEDRVLRWRVYSRSDGPRAVGSEGQEYALLRAGVHATRLTCFNVMERRRTFRPSMYYCIAGRRFGDAVTFDGRYFDQDHKSGGMWRDPAKAPPEQGFACPVADIRPREEGL